MYGQDVERRAEAEQERLDTEPAQIGVALRDELDQQDRESADRRQAAGDREILAADDVGVEEDEAAEEDLDAG